MANPVTNRLPAGKSPSLLTGFDRVAWCYDALAALTFGPALRNTQRAALAGLPAGAPHVLVLGGGTGWVLAEILRRRPAATVLYLEASPRMLARARARLGPGQQRQVVFRHGTQNNLEPADTFDAIVTFFVLDCLPEAVVPAALARLDAARRPGAPWLLADFRPAGQGWRRGLLTVMYAFFRFTTGLTTRTMTDFTALLLARGLRLQSRQLFFAQAVEAVVMADEAAASGKTVSAS